MTARIEAIRDAFVATNAVVVGDVRLAPGVNIWFNAVVRGDLAAIEFGPCANLQDGVVVHTDTGKSMTIEEGVVVGHSAILHGERIGARSLIGMGAILLSGSVIGEESLVAAGSLVLERQRIPPRSVVMGSPAKVVRSITHEELERTRSICEHYLEMARRHANGEFPPPWRA